MTKFLMLAPLLLAAGCAAVGPNYQRPALPLAPAFVGGNAAQVQDLATRAWWRDYRDPLLNDFVARGLAQNLDIQAAQERIRAAEANLRATGMNDALSGSGSAGRVKSGGDQNGTGYRSSSSLSAALVIDLFGGVRRAREAAQADLTAAQADLEAQRLAWLGELIAAYGNARYYQQALALTRDTVRSRTQTVEITRSQLDAGAGTELDVAQAQALLDTAKANIPQYQAQFDANVFALAALLDEPAEPLLQRMRAGAPPLRTPGTVPTGVPADLLRNRPDVRASEADFQAAVAEVGVATADMLPALTLSGSVANAGGTKSWSFGPGLSLPILSQGRLSAQRDAKVSAAKQAEIAWRGAVNAAVRDVQVAQSNLTQYRRQAAALNKAAASYGAALRLAEENYRAGATDLLDLLDTERSRSAARISAAAAANAAAQEWATLQIATGAGAAIAR